MCEISKMAETESIPTERIESGIKETEKMQAERVLSDGEQDFTVQELMQELMQDDSWEPNPDYRRKAIGMLMMSVFPVC